MRKFDTEDRDPATTSTFMRNFATTLRCLFVEGWIMVDPRSSPSASTGAAGVFGDEVVPPKTVTQIIFEQLQGMVYIHTPW